MTAQELVDPPVGTEDLLDFPPGVHLPVSIEDLLQFPAVLDLLTAAKVLGIGRTTAYALARSGRFPCRLIKVGSTYRVPTADLHRLLGLHHLEHQPALLKTETTDAVGRPAHGSC